MAYEQISISVTGMDAIEDALRELLTKTKNLKKPMEAIGSYLSNVAEESFDTETSPSGEAWSPLAESTKKYKEKHGGDKILQSGSRTLRESVGYQADEEGVIVGVNAYSSKGYPYPAVHQFGTTKNDKIPSRPFMPVDVQGELYSGAGEEIIAILKEYLEK